MNARVLLIDYENVQAVDLARLPPDVRVWLVLGIKQSKLPADLVMQAQGMGERFRYVPIKGQQPNAVDFCIAYYLGEFLHADPTAECVILSKDKKGFDPLVRHLNEDRDLRVRRVNSQKEAFSAAGPPPGADRPTAPKKTAAHADAEKPAVPKKAAPHADAPFERLLSLLRKEKTLPQKRKGLAGKIGSYFPKESAESQRRLLERLVEAGLIVVEGTSVSYRL